MQEESQPEEVQASRVYCANCLHCKLVRTDEEKAVLRIRCTAGKWKKKLGEEKIYKYCSIGRRYSDLCEAYEDMGESAEFIRDLRKSVLEESGLFGD
jgi:hypothetical protein